jgi:type IX secretion system PorP/SprF family membrane protein
MKRKTIFSLSFLLLIGCCLIPGKSNAQVDAHFSQYYAYPLWLNPGLTGVMDGDYRITANYKRQWASITSPFSTEALSFDTYPYKHLGLGATVLNQSAGDGGYNYLNAMVSAAYRAILDEKGVNILSIGLQAGVINRRFNPNKLQFGSQYDPILGFNPATPSGENFDKTSSTAFDANFGIVYFNGDPNTRLNPFGGVSLYHLSRPEDPFLGTSNKRLPMRLNIHGGVRIKLNEQFNLTPQGLYIRQGNAHEVAVGAYLQYLLPSYSDFLFGATYRLDDAVIPFIGFHLGDYTFGLSYDINVSQLRAASEGRGGIELSVSYIRHKKVRDPRFICPRL